MPEHHEAKSGLPTIPRAPVLLLVFNRPNVTAQVFKSIRAARPPRLYIAADGPRPGRVGEAELVSQTRAIATAVDWDCVVKTLFRDENLGCKMAVSGAITWFFEHEDCGIILEDDCLPEPSFFPFCETLLERYRDDTRIWHIGGTNPLASAEQVSDGYFFSRYDSCWGWATWRRAWCAFDADMNDWPKLREAGALSDVFPSNATKHYSPVFDRVHEGNLDSWAYAWTFARARNGWSAVPKVNLVQNLGFGPEATHTTDSRNPMARIGVGQIMFPLKHPMTFAIERKRDLEWERFAFRRRPIRLGLIKIREVFRALGRRFGA